MHAGTADGERSAAADDDRAGRTDDDRAGRTDGGTGQAGWLLVGVVLLALVVAPLLIYWRPPALPFEVAFLVLPLAPAFLLGATAVWVAVRSRRENN